MTSFSNGAGPSRSRGPDETAAILSKLELFFGTPTFTSALGEFGQQHCGAFRALLAEGAERPALVARLREAFALDEPAAAHDVDAFLADLEARALLEP